MKKLLRTLYILTPDSYLYWRNENVCIKVGGTEKVAIPALTLDAIVCFGQMTVSTPLLQACGEHGISVTFLSERGQFQWRFYGPVSGNVLLRKRQYESLDQEEFCCGFVQNLLYAKIRNAKLVLMRAARNAKEEAEKLHLECGVDQLGELAKKLSQCQDVDDDLLFSL